MFNNRKKRQKKARIKVEIRFNIIPLCSVKVTAFSIFPHCYSATGSFIALAQFRFLVYNKPLNSAL